MVQKLKDCNFEKSHTHPYSRPYSPTNPSNQLLIYCTSKICVQIQANKNMYYFPFSYNVLHLALFT